MRNETSFNDLREQILATDEAIQEACWEMLNELDRQLDGYGKEQKLDLASNSPVWKLLILKQQCLRLIMEINKAHLENVVKMGLVPDSTQKDQKEEIQPERTITWDQVLTGIDESCKDQILENLEREFEQDGS